MHTDVNYHGTQSNINLLAISKIIFYDFIALSFIYALLKGIFIFYLKKKKIDFLMKLKIPH